jgi:hypothetical protein
MSESEDMDNNQSFGQRQQHTVQPSSAKPTHSKMSDLYIESPAGSKAINPRSSPNWQTPSFCNIQPTAGETPQRLDKCPSIQTYRRSTTTAITTKIPRNPLEPQQQLPQQQQQIQLDPTTTAAKTTTAATDS